MKERGVALRYVERAERRENEGSLSGRLLKKPVQQGRRREKTGGVASGYVEDFVELRTQVAGFFSNLP